MGFDDYFLINYDLVNWAKNEARMLVGPGRGSGASSLVGYALGITDLDPIDLDLIFERFLNPGRVTMPDIDLDYPEGKVEIIVVDNGSTDGTTAWLDDNRPDVTVVALPENVG